MTGNQLANSPLFIQMNALSGGLAEVGREHRGGVHDARATFGRLAKAKPQNTRPNSKCLSGAARAPLSGPLAG